MTDHWCKYCNGMNTQNCQFNTNLPRMKIYPGLAQHSHRGTRSACRECGCVYGAEWGRALRLADDAAESVICTEGHSPRERQWVLYPEQIAADPYLEDCIAYAALKAEALAAGA